MAATDSMILASEPAAPRVPTAAAAARPSAPEAEYRALVESCGLLDRSERGRLALSGPDAKAFLNGQVTNDIQALTPGTGCYAAFLTPKGKMLGDLRVLDAGADTQVGDSAKPSDVGEELLLDTERVALQALFEMIRRYRIGYRVELHKRTLERGLLSLIGPDAARVAGVSEPGDQARTGLAAEPGGQAQPGVAAEPGDGTGGGAPLGAAEHSSAPVTIAGIKALAVRTDTGVDLLCDAADTHGLAEALRARGATPVHQAAAEVLRVEHGRPRYGVDIDETTIPQEAGLNERAVSFTKGCYTGQETVARLHYRGKPNRLLRGLRLTGPVPPGADLRLGERLVGRLTSSVLSPTHGLIGLALVRREAPPGTRLDVSPPGEPGVSLTVGEHDLARAEIVELPFTSGGSPRAGDATVGPAPAAGADPPALGADLIDQGEAPS